VKQRVTVTLPYPPSANRYWRTTRDGRTYVSAEAKQYKKDVAKVAGRANLTGELRLTMFVYRPRKTGDLSNRIKVLEDALQGVLFNDDKQISEIYAVRLDDKQNPRVEVTVEEI
jgi:crossover junction endodeoxyribonuclease RusA